MFLSFVQQQLNAMSTGWTLFGKLKHRQLENSHKGEAKPRDAKAS